MKFSDLLTQPFNENTGIIDLKTILSVTPNTPEQVAQQFYSDHGRKENFQSLYGKLNIEKIQWSLTHLRAAELLNCSINKDFEPWVLSVSKRAQRFPEHGWRCIDSRKDVQMHWANFGTWAVKPVLLSGPLAHTKKDLHLVEGHTRIGTLKGLISQGIISINSTHEAWIGS